jgi:hypothetical protein
VGATKCGVPIPLRHKSNNWDKNRVALSGCVNELEVRPSAHLVSFDTGMSEDEICREAIASKTVA